MQIILANAKIMYSNSNVAPISQPHFISVANNLATEMSSFDIEGLAKQLDCSHKLAAENWLRYQNYFTAETLPAIMAYNGQAYKHLRAKELMPQDLVFAQNHLWITCFLYGLLRPMDAIVPYRMEHCVQLKTTADKPINQYWKNILTDFLVDSVKADGGTLLHLSTEEYEHLFDWKRVCKDINVIKPLFYVRQSNGQLKMQAVWAKSCRGAMVRFVIRNRITDHSELKHFSYEGFEYQPNLGEECFPHFIRE